MPVSQTSVNNTAAGAQQPLDSRNGPADLPQVQVVELKA
jgi:hypothetical protein